MKTFFIVVALLAAGWILLMLSLRRMASLLRKSTHRTVLKTLTGEEILKITSNASYIGADFPGPNLPPRTSGVLAVTPTRILFMPWFPRRPITIPRTSLAGVALQDHFRDMAYNIPALVLTIKGVGNRDGKMGWLTHDPEEWQKNIRKMIRNP